MTYLNENDNLYYSDEGFTTLANGLFTIDGVDIYYIGGVITSLDYNGTGIWNDTPYQYGQVFTGTGFIENIITFIGAYIVNGQITTLQITGNGYWNSDPYIEGQLVTDGFFEGADYGGSNTYYIGGVATTLSEYGTGIWNDTPYMDGEVFTGTGWIEDWQGAGGSTNGGYYYIDGVATNLDLWGSGVWNDVMYLDGGLFTDGYYYPTNIYYIGGVATTLDQDGIGVWNNLTYVFGIIANGFDYDYYYAYFIDGVSTTLNESGSGSWEGNFYINGEIYVHEGGPVNLTSGLEAFYKLDDTSDSSGNGNTLTNNGDVGFSSGKIGNAAVFDGSNWMSSPVDQTGITNYALACWVKVDSLSGPQFLINGLTGNAWQNGGIVLDLGDGYPITYANFGGDGNGYGLTSQTQLVADTWYHLVGVRINGQLRIYINGSLDCVSDTIYNTPIPGGNPISLGQNADGTYGPLVGSIDAVGIWSRALNSTEIAALYNSGNGLEEFGGSPVTSSSVIIQGNTKFYGKVKFA